MALNPASFQTRDALTDFSIRAANEMTDFIADSVFPYVYVTKEQFKTYQYDLSNYREVDTMKSSKAEADLVDYGVFTKDRTARLHKLAGEWDPADEKNFDKVVADLQQDTAKTVVERLMLRKERLAVTLALTAGNYPAALTSTLAAGSTWLDTNGDVEGNSRTARVAVKTACGKAPNAAAMSWTTFEGLKVAPSVVDRIKYTNGQQPTEEILKNLLGVQHLFVSKAQYNSAVEGSTASLSDVWDDSVLYFVYDPSPAPRTMRYGSTYIRNELYTYQYKVDERGSGDGRIERLEMGLWYVHSPGSVVSSSDDDFTAGYLLKNAV